MSLKVKYIIPEDGDSIDHPNLFRMRIQPEEVITLQGLKQQFPVPGEYQFRCMSTISGLKVWRDLTYDEDCIPNVGGIVLIKANRLSAVAGVSLQRPSPGVLPKKPPTPTARAVRQPSDRLLSFDDGDLLGARSPKGGESDLLGFEVPTKASISSPDLFGLQSMPMTQSGNQQQPTTQPMQQQQPPMRPQPPFVQQGAAMQGASYGVGSGGGGGGYAYGASRPANVDAFSGLTDLKGKK